LHAQRSIRAFGTPRAIRPPVAGIARLSAE
jgi:hypothetical protein